MFISKRAHTELVKTLVEQYESRISQLQDQIQDLRRLVFTPTSASDIPLVHLEADAILSAADKQPAPHKEMTAEEEEKMNFLLREADRIFSGNFEEAM